MHSKTVWKWRTSLLWQIRNAVGVVPLGFIVRIVKPLWILRHKLCESHKQAFRSDSGASLSLCAIAPLALPERPGKPLGVGLAVLSN